MATVNMFGYDPASIAAPVPAYPVFGGGGVGRQVLSFYVKMKCTVAESAPGAGVLLCTINYWDGEVMQPLNISLNLTAVGDYSMSGGTFQQIWWDRSGPDTTLEFSYVGSGGTDGAADVTIDYVEE